MDVEVLRMIERLLVVVSGTASLYFGYSLFLKGIVSEQKGNIEIPGTLKISAAHFAPGIFFAALGTAILVTSLLRGITVSNGQISLMTR